MIGNHIKKYILLLFLLGAATMVFAQKDTTLTQEVEVVKAYKPSISDANKINDMPKMDEEEPQKPTFQLQYFQPAYFQYIFGNLR